MANPTSNFGWQMPTNTDLVKDLPADFETFGQAVDTSLADLKGGTTGQVLSKNSNTDMDFVWVAQDDSNAIQNAIVDAKGDLITATAADTPARLAVGSNGQVLTADSSAATGLAWATATSGGWTSLASGNLSGTSTSVSITTTGYKELRVFQKNVVCTTDWYQQIRLNSDSGSNYNVIETHQTSSTAQTSAVFSATTGIFVDVLFDLNDSDSFAVYTIFDPANTDTKKAFEMYCSGLDASASYRQSGYARGSYNGTTAAITNVTFVPSSTFSSGTYEIYGVK